jgi:hypothetical protein
MIIPIIRPLPWPFPWPWPEELTERSNQGEGNLQQVVEMVYLRPDVRAAVTTLTPSFAELLSRNEKAARQFDELVGGLPTGPGTERIVPLLAYGLVILAGAAVGYLSRP